MDSTHSKSDATAQPVRGRPFPKGISGNPGGRPVGSKNKIQADFLRELSEDFANDGRDAIKRMREDDPSGYVRMVASLLPKEVKVDARPFDSYTDDELRRAIDLLNRYHEAGEPSLDLIARYFAAGSPALGGATIEGEAVALSVPDERG